jgi:hypothetical protein
VPGAPHGGEPEPVYGVAVLSSVKSCGICGHKIYEDFAQRETGDFHGKCYDSLTTSGLRLTIHPGEDAACLMCARPIAKGAVAVELIDTATAHLRCFFGTTNGRAQSLGAAAATRSAAERGRALRAQSDALVNNSRLLVARLRVHLPN